MTITTMLTVIGLHTAGRLLNLWRPSGDNELKKVLNSLIYASPFYGLNFSLIFCLIIMLVNYLMNETNSILREIAQLIILFVLVGSKI